MPAVAETQQQEALRQEATISRQILEETPRLWWALWCHQNSYHQQLDFTRNYWLHAIYQDNSNRIVIPKSSKTFISEWLITDMLSLAMRGLNGMYILPDQPIRNRFITSRIDPVLGAMPTLNIRSKEVDKSVDEKGLKTLFGTTWAFVGAKNPDTFYEFTADALIIDEYDKCNPISLKLSEDRILAAKEEIWRRVGNPSFPDIGIEKEYAASDQKIWLVRCEHCNEWQELDWFEHFVEQVDEVNYRLRWESVSHNAVSSPYNDGRDIAPLCRHCQRPFNRLGRGEWVAKHPDREISGYRVSRLFWQSPEADTKRESIEELYQNFQGAIHNQSALQLFYNNRLGLPYYHIGDRVDENMLASCVDPKYAMPLNAEGTFAGVDTGSQLHTHISKIEKGKRKKVFIGCLADFNELDRVCKLYGVVGGVIDPLSDLHAARKFIQDHPGWYACYYTKESGEKLDGEGKQGKWISTGDFKYNPAANAISANRTESLDASLEHYIRQQVLLPHDYESIDKGDFVKQMCLPVRIKKERPDGSFYYVWTKGEDHHRHADNYERMASTLGDSGSNLVTVYEMRNVIED